jgi:hypothetical protein
MSKGPTFFARTGPLSETGVSSSRVAVKSLAATPAAASIEVPTFTVDESSELMLQILNWQDISLDEVEASRDLSEKLGGLALVLDIIAKQVRTRKKSIREFLPYYDEHHRTLHKRPKRGIIDPYYDKDLLTVWRPAFEDLSLDSAKLISLLCFVAPESIPQWLLIQEMTLPEEWMFLSNPEE